MVEKARSSESLHYPTSRLGPRIFWWLQMWRVVVSTSKMCLWLSTMIWPKTLKVSAVESSFNPGKGRFLARFSSNSSTEEATAVKSHSSEPRAACPSEKSSCPVSLLGVLSQLLGLHSVFWVWRRTELGHSVLMW